MKGKRSSQRPNKKFPQPLDAIGEVPLSARQHGPEYSGEPLSARVLRKTDNLQIPGLETEKHKTSSIILEEHEDEVSTIKKTGDQIKFSSQMNY